MSVWAMWAGVEDAEFWDVADDDWYPKEYGHATPVRVLVTEDQDGPYWGWLDTSESAPSMVYPHLPLFTICFPYGPEAEQEAGHGRIVRLSIREATETEWETAR